MEQVGSQVTLPFRRAVRIAVQGIRIRLGRSLVTVSGVVLGIAFLMSNLTGQLIRNTLAAERELRQQIGLMQTIVKSEVGQVHGKTLAVAVCGALREPEHRLLDWLLAGKPTQVRAIGWETAGVTRVEATRLGEGAVLLLVLGDRRAPDVSLAELTAGMKSPVVLDTLAERVFPGGVPTKVRRELFFGAQLAEQKARLAQATAAARVRTLWIVTVSLLVTVIGVSNALLMSVTERFREIGTMKCLGALSGFIRRLFLIESSLIGSVGSVLGVAVGALLTMVIYGLTYSFGPVFGGMAYGWLALAGLGATVIGTLLAVLAAIYPATFASRMVPASALRSTV